MHNLVLEILVLQIVIMITRMIKVGIMKRLYSIITITFAAAFLLTGCAKDKGEEPQPQTFHRTVSVSFTKGADTKTAVVEGENKAFYIWTTGDDQYFKVYENTTLGTVTNISYSNDMKKATLTVDFNSPTANEYVYKAKFASHFSQEGNPEIISEQNPSATSYDPAADVMISDAITSSTGLTSLMFTMNRVVTVNKLTLKGLETDETISKVEVTFNKNVAGFYTYSGTNAGNYSGSSKKLTLNYSGGAAVLSDGTFPVYFISMPVESIALESVVVYTDKNTYNKSTFTKTYDFAIGQMARFGINMAGYGTPISSSKSYTLVESSDDLVDGAEYIIAAKNASDNYYAMGTFAGNSYHPSVNVTTNYSSGTITLDNTSSVEPVILVKSGSNWLIKDDASSTYNGYYLASTANKNSTEQTSSFEWTIEIDSGNATITPTSNSSYGRFQYNSQNPRFCCYASDQTTPSLYKLNGSAATLGISFAEASYSFSLNSSVYEAFTGQVVTKNSSDTRTVTYSMSGSAIGTINSSTGAVTLNGTTTGIATVTATVGEAPGYKAGSVSYTITVTAASGSDVTDVLTTATFPVSGTSYADFSGVTVLSSAVYSANCASNNGSYIQLRSNTNSGIVTTTSAGRVAKVKVTWNSSTEIGRTLNIYAKNTAYNAVSDLYDSNKHGILVGSIVRGTSTEFTFAGDYNYIGLRSNSGAMYITQIEITWGEGGSSGGGGGEAPTGWLELPVRTTGSDYFNGVFFEDDTKTVRNYSYMYQYSTYTSLWTAYPLYSSVMSSSAPDASNPKASSWRVPMLMENVNGNDWTIASMAADDWNANPIIAKSDQVNVWSASYNVIYGQTNYVENASTASEYYARGHQIPDGDRSGSSNTTMLSHTYYATNSTPQIQNKFNATIWAALERGARDCARGNGANDTVYVVTGAAFQKLTDGTETITYIHPKGDPTKSVPVPKYYWKVLLKVKWNGSGEVTDAKMIGFWLPHQQYTGNDYTPYVKSVSQIEAWTGFCFFDNLPASLKTAEIKGNTNWSSFQSF